MAGVRLGQAFAAGFVLIRRRPVAVFAWGVLLLLLVQAPAAFILLHVATGILPLISHMGPMSPEAANVFGLQLQQRMVLAQAMNLPTFIVRAVIAAAIYRAVLEPRQSAFASIRLGRQEAWLFLLPFAFVALSYLVLIPLELVLFAGIAAAATLGAALQAPYNVIAPVAAGLALLLALLWAMARLSLAGPMTFAEREFRLFESWSATRRQGWRLLGLGLLLFLFLLLVEVIFWGIVIAVVLSMTGGRSISPHQIGDWIVALRDLDLRQAAVWLVPLAVVAAAVFGAINAIAVAPWASAYQQLNPRPDARA